MSIAAARRITGNPAKYPVRRLDVSWVSVDGEVTAVAVALRETTANLAAYIAARAEQIAAEAAAAERVAEVNGQAEFDRKHFADVKAELHRQLEASHLHAERALMTCRIPNISSTMRSADASVIVLAQVSHVR